MKMLIKYHKFMQEKVFFSNKDGLRLCGVLSSPINETHAPVVVLCHGFPSSKNANSMIAMETALNEKSISTLRIDFFGVGESDGEFEDITLTEWVENIFSAVDYLKSIGYRKVGLFGSSTGGGMSIMAASKLKDLFALALKAPAVDHVELEIAERGTEGIEKWKEEGYAYYTTNGGEKYKSKYAFFDDMKNNIGYDVAEKITAPTLIVHGEADREVPIGQSQKVSQLILNCQLESIPGADHKFSKPEDFEKMVKLISDFISKQAKK